MFKRRSAAPGAGLPPLLVASVTVLGCHGGAGTTTVNRMLAPAAHEGAAADWQLRPEPLVLVAKGTAYGLKWATEWVGWAKDVMRGLNSGSPAFPPVLLAVVADSPLQEPATVRARVRLVQDQVGGVVRFPYVPAWADLDDPLSVPAPHTVVAAAAELRNLLSSIHQIQLGAVRG